MDVRGVAFVEGRRGLVWLALAGVLAVVLGCQRQEAVQRQTSPASSEPIGVTIEQVQQWMQAGEPLVFLDSRSASAWDAGTTRVPGSIRVPPDDVASHLAEIPKDRKIIAYCT